MAVSQHDGRHALPELITVDPGVRSVGSLSEKAYYLLRDRLITLDLAPGSTIDERALQRELGLGRTPIREALRRLADDRLVDVVPRRGMFASHVDFGDLRSISEVRVELEGYAARLAARRARSQDLEAVDELLAELGRTAAADQRDLVRLDQRVHRLLYRATGNPFLAATLEEYFVHSLRQWFLVLDHLSHLEHAVGEHIDLLVAIRDGDADSAERILRRHVADFEDKIRAVL
ncbi:GntR family transcriptional regulator [Saccharopolyspora oryzae]|uniref:GntR family transcriptional regulator n=1 Tax=Saccharopolyspora oryzae TaxID=2997343 RepID=A0ABT4UQ74_9PSEU|nr:GntR family transcriptional regulator [Saccharopolyspora oryzae]MDA3623876.1 GntR family transcriptional regulator [Saccharopolyspora oryzae]